MGPDFIQLSGEDATALGFMAHGGHGCISVTSNVAPRLCAQFQTACMADAFQGALILNDRLQLLHSALFVEPNPAGPKYALSLLGRAANVVRLPLVPLTSAGEATVRRAMEGAGLL
jgi:4-hydroxy-tetrahydrodipicolinate synthase